MGDQPRSVGGERSCAITRNRGTLEGTRSRGTGARTRSRGTGAGLSS